MSAVLAATTGPSIAWYLTRATGTVALLLLTASVALGVLDVGRASSPRWPRFVLDALHRNVSLLAVVFIALHVITTVLDSFAHISIVAASIPFTSSYRPFWLGLGAVALDLLLAVSITSLLRRRLGFSTWRATHWLAYACWPIALVHGLGTGSDAKSKWMLAIAIGGVLVVIAAVCTRALRGWPANARLRGSALALSGAFALFLVLWVRSGPLGSEWARRSGTPISLLPHASRTRTHR
jgi:sulfoxide reductase heme-binding subunit YedZ